MVHKLLAAGVFLALAVIAACSDGGDPSATPAATAPPALTGILSVDAAIDAIERRDADALAAQVQPSAVNCSVRRYPLSPFPPCNGEPNGTLFERFPVSRCDEYDDSPVSAELTIRELIAPSLVTVRVHSVFEIRGGPLGTGFFWTAEPRYAIILETAQGESLTGSGLLLNHEGIVGFVAGCDSSPSDFLLESGLDRPIVPPPTPTALPTPPRTGIAAVDAAIDAIQRKDADALIAQMRMTLLPCVAEPMGLSPFPQCDGAPDGTLLERFPVSSCEIGYAPRDVAEPIVGSVALSPPEAQVYSVFRTAGTRFDKSFYSHASPKYVNVLRRVQTDRVAASTLLISDEGVVGQVGACLATPAGVVSFWELTDAIIPPPDER